MFKKFMTMMVVVSVLGVSGCDSGGGGGGERTRSSTEIKGRAVDAQISGGDISVFSFENGEKGAFLAGTRTNDKGFYSLSLTALDQFILIELRGGSYVEEASGTSVSLADGQVLRAVTFYKSGVELDLMITPFTNVAVGLIEYKIAQGDSVENAVTQATVAISSMAGVDILKVSPANITDIKNIDTDFTSELKYGALAAAISSWTKKASETNGVEPHTVWTSIRLAQIMYIDIKADGLLDGKGRDSKGESVGLAFGLVLLDANTYRAELAQHLMGVIAGKMNLVGITLSQAVIEADRLAGTTHPMFGALAPVPLDEEGPLVVRNEPEGRSFNKDYTFKVSVEDAVGIKSVVFDIAGEDVAQALDPSHPEFTINTQSYADGAYFVGVQATDNVGNWTYATFSVNFKNSGSTINLSSSGWTNSSPVDLSGTYLDNGTGIQSITADGVPVTLNIDTQSWSVTVPLEDASSPLAFEKDVLFVMTDANSTQTFEKVPIKMDKRPPQFNAPTFGTATFSDEGQVFGASVSIAERGEDRNPLSMWISTDNTSLNGTQINTTDLDDKKIPWIRLTVRDHRLNEIFTPFDEITAELQYSLAGEILNPWHPLEPTNEGTSIRLIPFASEVLAENWDQATKEEEHLIQVRIKDLAGNTALYSFRFKVEFVPPAGVLAVLKTPSSRSSSWVGSIGLMRASYYGKELGFVSYEVRNTGNRTVLFKPSKVFEESVRIEQRYDAVIRSHKVQKLETEAWEARDGYLAVVSDSGEVIAILRAEPAINYANNVRYWHRIRQVYHWYGAGAPYKIENLFRIAPPGAKRLEITDLSSDSLPLRTKTQPESFVPTIPPPGRMVRGIDLFSAIPVKGVNFFGPAGAGRETYLRRYIETSYVSVQGTPKNIVTPSQESFSGSTEYFKMTKGLNQEHVRISNGWYRLLPGQVYSLTRYIAIPTPPNYSRRDPLKNSLYTEVRYENQIELFFNRSLSWKTIHDTGFNNSEQMSFLENQIIEPLYSELKVAR